MVRKWPKPKWQDFVTTSAIACKAEMICLEANPKINHVCGQKAELAPAYL